MNEHVDEEIGALLDGRLDLRRRTELLGRLATDDVDYEVFADTAAVLREAEDEEPAGNEYERGREAVRETEVIPLRPRRAAVWRSPGVRVLAAAAALAAIGLVPVIRGRMNEGAWRDPERLAALATAGTALPAAWLDSIPWSRHTRGPADSVSATAAAARVGARSTDLAVAVRSGDREHTPLLAGEIAFTLDEVRAAGFAAEVYRQIADSTAWSRAKLLKRVADAHTGLAGFVDEDYLAVGAWAEAARLAANRQDTAFFSGRESRKALERAEVLEGLNDDAKQAVTALRSVQKQDGIQDWSALQANLYTLLREIAK